MHLLTTITPYWGRFKTLETWIEAIKGAQHPEVVHFLMVQLYTIEEKKQLSQMVDGTNIILFFFPAEVFQDKSIGFFHDMGAKYATTEWIMKLDVDAIPNTRYFEHLLPFLAKANPRQWFNGGMAFMAEAASNVWLDTSKMPLLPEAYFSILSNPRSQFLSGKFRVEASNFICRRDDYIALGGCDPHFKLWGWEDYQQMFMLEAYALQTDPLPGEVNINNVTQRCRDEIGRPKARELFEKESYLCLLHKWHTPNANSAYKSRSQSNKIILLDYILKYKRNHEHGK